MSKEEEVSWIKSMVETRTDWKLKMINEHNKAIEWHEKEIKKIKKQMHELSKMYYMLEEEG